MVQNELPDISYYNPESMKLEDRQTFITWYKEHKDYDFNFQTESLEYCKSDFDILMRFCLSFMYITNVDPFAHPITIASACQLVFHTNFLEAETIALIPHHGYNPEEKEHRKALQWLMYISYTEDLAIQHLKNGNEISMGPYLVNG